MADFESQMSIKKIAPPNRSASNGGGNFSNSKVKTL